MSQRTLYVKNLAGLSRIAGSDVEMVIRPRRFPVSISRRLTALPRHGLQPIVLTGRPEDVADRFRQTLEFRGFAKADPKLATFFCRDVARLAHAFSEVISGRRVTVDFRVQPSGSGRFHADGVPLRLYVAYRGPGFEWIPDGSVDRRRIYHEKDPAAFDRHVKHLPRGAVAVFKGGNCCDPSDTETGLIHRSPQRLDPDFLRVLLVINPASY